MDFREEPVVDVESRPVYHIVAEQGLSSRYLRDTWDSRELIRVLIQRDLRVRYKQTVFGVGWVVLQPLCTAAVYSLLFGVIARMPSDGVPYPIFLLTALLPWQFVQRLISEGSSCIAGNTHLVGKVYFPRLVLPISVLGSLTVDLLVGIGVCLVVMLLYGYYPNIHILALPLVIVFSASIGVSVALLLGPVDVNYRDVRMIIPLVLQVVMFISPIFYSASILPERIRWLFDMNPVAVMATSMRWSLLGHGNLPTALSIVGAVTIIAVTMSVGIWLFVRAECRFADRI